MIQKNDTQIMLWIQTHMHSEWMDIFMKFMTSIGDGLALLALALVVYFIAKKDKRNALQLLLSLTVAMLLNQIILKNIVRRPRPFVTHDNLQSLIEKPTSFSFPSSHSASAFAFASAISRKYKFSCGIWFAIASLIAFSRVYLNVHYPSDILVGAVVGIVSSELIRKFLARYVDF